MAAKLLLIDDDEDQLTLLKMLLQFSGFNIEITHNAEEGWSRLTEGDIDCVVCDLMMPGMSGKEFISKLRSDAQHGKVPIVLLTAASMDVEIDLLSEGANAVCFKTELKKTLIPKINQILATN